VGQRPTVVTVRPVLRLHYRLSHVCTAAQAEVSQLSVMSLIFVATKVRQSPGVRDRHAIETKRRHAASRLVEQNRNPMTHPGGYPRRTRSNQVREARGPAGAGLPGSRPSQAIVTTTLRFPSPGGGTSAPVVMLPKKLSRIETRRGFEPTTVAWFPSE
jgi:hypothetical protein